MSYYNANPPAPPHLAPNSLSHVNKFAPRGVPGMATHNKEIGTKGSYYYGTPPNYLNGTVTTKHPTTPIPIPIPIPTPTGLLKPVPPGGALTRPPWSAPKGNLGLPVAGPPAVPSPSAGGVLPIGPYVNPVSPAPPSWTFQHLQKLPPFSPVIFNPYGTFPPLPTSPSVQAPYPLAPYDQPQRPSKDPSLSRTSQHQHQHQPVSYTENPLDPLLASKASLESRSLAAGPPESIEAASLFQKNRETPRPKIVIIMRGLPGSGKTYMTKIFSSLEMKYSGNSPRVMSVDDYFLEEVEQEFDDPEDPSGKKKVKVLEYNYEEEMVESYKKSLLKAFAKTVSQGYFQFIIVDNVNHKICDFEPYWFVAKNAGFEVYVFETEEKDVKVCAKQNIHNFTRRQIEAIKKQWEQTPNHLKKITLGNLLNKDIFSLSEMPEVEMAADDNNEEVVEQLPLPDKEQSFKRFIEEQKSKNEEIFPISQPVPVVPVEEKKLEAVPNEKVPIQMEPQRELKLDVFLSGPEEEPQKEQTTNSFGKRNRWNDDEEKTEAKKPKLLETKKKPNPPPEVLPNKLSDIPSPKPKTPSFEAPRHNPPTLEQMRSSKPRKSILKSKNLVAPEESTSIATLLSAYGDCADDDTTNTPSLKKRVSFDESKLPSWCAIKGSSSMMHKKYLKEKWILSQRNSPKNLNVGRDVVKMEIPLKEIDSSSSRSNRTQQRVPISRDKDKELEREKQIRERDRERDRDRGREERINSEREKLKEREKERDRDRYRDKERERDKERDRDRGRERDKRETDRLSDRRK